MNFVENETPDKLRGGYYTPVDIATFLARWILKGGARRILEPSAGDGAFFESISHHDGNLPLDIVACEIHPAEAAKSRRRAKSIRNATVTVHATDYLEWSLKRIQQPGDFDGVVGNPPFIRYQYLSSELQGRSQEIFKHLGLPFTKHTNAWVPFVLASVSQLRPGGRLAMVVPAEILHVLHAQALRSYLLKSCSRVHIVDPQELWFGETLQGVVLLLVEKTEIVGQPGRLAITPVRERSFLQEDPELFFEGGEFLPGSEVPRKWMLAFLNQRERSLLLGLRSHRFVREFQDIASVDVGIVTGANKFFLVPDAIVEQFGLAQWAHPMFGRSEHVRGVIFDRRSHDDNRQRGLPANFLWFGNTEMGEFPESVQRYIRDGEKQKLHQRYKCRIRAPWYNVPSVSAAPIGLLKRSHNFPRLTLNSANAFTTDTAYRIHPKSVAASRLVYSFINSMTALTAELEGRHYGGGVLELVPSEIERLLVPTTPMPTGALLRLDKEVRAGLAPEEILGHQDKSILRALGATQQDSNDLLGAWYRLRSRRHRIDHPDINGASPEKSRYLDEKGLSLSARRAVEG